MSRSNKGKERTSGRGRGPSSRGRSSSNSLGARSELAEPMSFFDLEIKPNVKFDIRDIGPGKIWFVKVDSSGEKPVKLLRMYCTRAAATAMQKIGKVYEYTPPLADKAKGETCFTLIIQVNNILKYNPFLRKHDIYGAAQRALATIDHRFGLAPSRSVNMHVSILPANEKFAEPSGKVFINLDQIWAVEKIAALRELLCGTVWSLDMNEITGYCHYMHCFYTVEKDKTNKLEEKEGVILSRDKNREEEAMASRPEKEEQ